MNGDAGSATIREGVAGGIAEPGETLNSYKRIAARLLGLFPLTATGFVVLFGSAVAGLRYGIYREDRVLLVAGVAGLVLLGTCLLLTGAVVTWLWAGTRDTEVPGLELLVGRAGRTGFVLTTPWWLPLIDIRWTVSDPSILAKQLTSGRTYAEQFTPARRGVIDQVERWFTAGDVFGLTSVRFPITTRQDIRFLPDEGSLRKVEVVRGLAAGDQFAHPEGRPQGDLQDIRNYGAGDPIRYVLWKVFAKSRTLVVRTPERALSPVRRTAAYLISSPHDQAAAGTAKTAVECGALGEEWRFGADGSSSVACDRRHALELVLRSGGACDPGAGLCGFLAAADEPKRVVVFAPAIAGPWVAQVLAAARSTKLELILCADDILPDPSRLAPVFLVPAPAPIGKVQVRRTQLAALVRQLGGVGTLRVVDRRHGRVFGAAHLAKIVGAA